MRALDFDGREVIVLEAQKCTGSEMSSRNSEVIHAGIYYPVESLKACFCVQERKQLYDFCDEHEEAYRRCGKFIIATCEQQQSQLQAILHNARLNDVDDIVAVDKTEV